MELFVGLSAGILLRFHFGCYSLIDIDGLEIHSNLNKFGKNMAKPSSALLERSFSVLSHLRRQQKSSYMKIQGDGSLIDIDVSLLEPVILSSFYVRKRHCIVVTWLAYGELIIEYCMF